MIGAQKLVQEFFSIRKQDLHVDSRKHLLDFFFLWLPLHFFVFQFDVQIFFRL